MNFLFRIGLVGALAITLTACGEETVEEAREVRPGCEKPVRGFAPKGNEIVAPEVWKQVSETGSAWVVIVLADESAQNENAEPDLEAIHLVQQRLLFDLDINDDEKVFGSEKLAIVSMQINPGRARQLENLPYVCYVGSDRKLWPME